MSHILEFEVLSSLELTNKLADYSKPHVHRSINDKKNSDPNSDPHIQKIYGENTLF